MFDAFTTGNWEHTCALMAGTGGGLANYNGMGSEQPEWHLYWSSEWVFSGTGPSARDSSSSPGIRTPSASSASAPRSPMCPSPASPTGWGATFRRRPWRDVAEWIKTRGMIANGTDGAAVPGELSNNGRLVASYNILPENEAAGCYLDGAYTLFDKLELRARFDGLNRGTDSAINERRFGTLTRGLTYALIARSGCWPIISSATSRHPGFMAATSRTRSTTTPTISSPCGSGRPSEPSRHPSRLVPG